MSLKHIIKRHLCITGILNLTTALYVLMFAYCSQTPGFCGILASTPSTTPTPQHGQQVYDRSIYVIMEIVTNVLLQSVEEEGCGKDLFHAKTVSIPHYTGCTIGSPASITVSAMPSPPAQNPAVAEPPQLVLRVKALLGRFRCTSTPHFARLENIATNRNFLVSSHAKC